jgi:hypothetical protein
VALILVAVTSTGAGTRPSSLSRFDATAVERALAGAAKRLQAPECQKLLTDFSDAEGRTLQEKLEGLGVSIPDYLQTISFLDGSATRSCKRGEVLMVATPDMPSVYVCRADGRAFSRLAQTGFRNPWLVESILIHEMLHTLGLGENPPTSQQITWQVQQRCHP